MAMTIEIWEDSGPISSGRGITQQEIDNLGWKVSGLDETYTFADYPVGRPVDGSTLYTVSYIKYYHFKIYGTYSSANDLFIKFQSRPDNVTIDSITATSLKVFYQWTNVYAEPVGTLMSGVWFDPDNIPIWSPLLSTTGPNGTMSYVPILSPDTTYYTPFFKTQLYVEPSTDVDYGNLKTDFKLRLDLDERKSGLYQYDPDLLNWT